MEYLLNNDNNNNNNNSFVFGLSIFNFAIFLFFYVYSKKECQSVHVSLLFYQNLFLHQKMK